MGGSHSFPSPPLGIELPSWLTPSERIELAKRSEEVGFAAVYSTEVRDPDPFVISAAVAQSTQLIHIGTSVIQIGTRSIPVMASAAAAVAQLAEGRFSLGLGVSSQRIVQGWHGQEWSQPLARAALTVRSLRTLLEGGRWRGNGSAGVAGGYRLTHAPTAAPPIYLAALNEGMLRVARKEADGVWLTLVPLDHVDQIVSSLKERGPRDRQFAVCLALGCLITDDVDAARSRLREQLLFYVASPSYRRALSLYGFAAEMDDARKALDRGDKQAASRAMSRHLIDALYAIGSTAKVRERIGGYLDAGITKLSLEALTPATVEDLLRMRG